MSAKGFSLGPHTSTVRPERAAAGRRLSPTPLALQDCLSAFVGDSYGNGLDAADSNSSSCGFRFCVWHGDSTFLDRKSVV